MMISSHTMPANIQARFEEQSASSKANLQKAIASGNKEEVIREKAKELESVFLAKMLEPMFPEDSALYGGGNGGDIYRQMMLQEYGKSFAESGGIGLADQLTKDMLKLQEVGK